MKRILVLISGLILTATAHSGVTDARQALEQTFTNVQALDFRPSPIEGLFEVTLQGSKVIYFHPESETLFFGEVFSKDGHSLTAEAVARANRVRLAKLPTDAALVLGPSDGTPIVEFTDPDCPYCRSYDQFIGEHENVKRIIFFMTDIHPDTAPAKAEHILCATDPEQAFHDVYAGKVTHFENCESGAKRLVTHAKVSREWGVRATPTLVLDGSPVQGFRREVVSNYLENTLKESNL